jgi:hypothetical protein
MTITYPLSLPTVSGIKRVNIRIRRAQGAPESPFTLTQQIQSHTGARWEFYGEIPIMSRADADEWIAWKGSLRGRVGTFLFGDPGATSPRGTWAGSPVADTAGSPTVGQAASLTLPVRGLSNGATVKAGDYFQLGSGLTSRLYRNLTNQTAGATGKLTLDIEPPLLSDVTDASALTTSSPKSLFRLADSVNEWSLEEGLLYGVFPIAAVEAI